MSVARSPESPSSARDVAPRARRVETSDAFSASAEAGGGVAETGGAGGARTRRRGERGEGGVRGGERHAARSACERRREGGGRDAAGRGARGETRRAETGEICGRRGLRAVEAELSANDRGARRETRGRRRARGGCSTRACVARGATPETNGACGCGDACVRGRMCRVTRRRGRASSLATPEGGDISLSGAFPWPTWAEFIGRFNPSFLQSRRSIPFESFPRRHSRRGPSTTADETHAKRELAGPTRLPDAPYGSLARVVR